MTRPYQNCPHAADRHCDALEQLASQVERLHEVYAKRYIATIPASTLRRTPFIQQLLDFDQRLDRCEQTLTLPLSDLSSTITGLAERIHELECGQWASAHHPPPTPPAA